jgi:hypothetical protein
MKKFNLVFIGILFLMPSFCFAHGGGHAPIESGKAKLIAGKVVADAVKGGKVDKSWEKILPGEPVKKTFKGHEEWVVVFSNLKIADKKKQKLHVFLSISGEVMGINYTGK